MRLCVALGCLLLVGCSGPHATGGLWAQQNVERELAMFRLSDAQRAEQTRAFEVGLADSTLGEEKSRIEAGLPGCLGAARASLRISVGDRPRDTVRLRAQGDAPRLAAVGQLALADWYLRRGRAIGDARLCDLARQVLTGGAGLQRRPLVALQPQSSVGLQPAPSDALERLGTATVTRDLQRPPSEAASGWSRTVTLSAYAMGWLDTVTAAAPLPQYLAAVYGGVLLGSVRPPSQTDLTGQTHETGQTGEIREPYETAGTAGAARAARAARADGAARAARAAGAAGTAGTGETRQMDEIRAADQTGQTGETPQTGEPAAELVDRLAPAYPDWEPDALYAAFVTP